MVQSWALFLGSSATAPTSVLPPSAPCSASASGSSTCAKRRPLLRRVAPYGRSEEAMRVLAARKRAPPRRPRDSLRLGVRLEQRRTRHSREKPNAELPAPKAFQSRDGLRCQRAADSWPVEDRIFAHDQRKTANSLQLAGHPAETERQLRLLTPATPSDRKSVV